MRFILTLTLALAALVFHAQIPSYVPSDGLVGYWPFNGNANDESGNGKDLTNSGLTYGTDNLGQSDASAVFDGSSSVAYRLNDGDLRPSSYTISVWIKTDVIQSGSLGGSEEQHIVGFTPSNWNIGPAYKLALDITDNSKLMHRQWITTSGWIDILTPSQTINSNNWYHLVAVFDSFLGKQKLYINGVLNSEISSQLEYSGQEGFFVGGSHENASGVLGSLFHGKINDLGFWNRALAEQEITTLYTSQTPTVCVPEYVPTNGLVGYWPFCGNANDESGNGNDGVVNGDVPFVADRNNNPSSAMQGGAGYVSVSSGFFNFGYSDPFSVSVWFTQSEGGGGRLISTESPEGQFRISTYGSGLNAMQYGNSQNYIYDTISDLNWHNYTFLYNGFGQASKYVDGHFEGNFTINSQEALIYGFPFTIGAKAAPAFDKWNGKIDDVAVYNRILTQQEITTLYTGQTPTVCMPDYVPTNGLVGYWPFCGNANDESGNGNDGVVNGATLTIDRNGNANSAYSFDGISNYIDVGNPPMLLGVTESYTQAGWAYYNDYSTANNGYTFMSKRHDNSGNDWATAITRSDGSLIFFADDAFYTGAIWARTNPITLNQWHFLAFVKSQDNYSIYVDGVLASSIVDSHQMGGSSNNLIIGAQLAWPEYMKGSLDDIGIWNRALTPTEIQQLYTGVLCTTPTAEITPDGPTDFCVGGSVTLNATADASYTYQWLKDGNPIDGATSASYTASTSGSYTVAVSSGADCSATSSETTVTVNELPVASITSASTTTFCSGSSVELNANAVDGYTYQWKLDGNNIAGANNANYAATESGLFTVVVTNASGCSTESSSIAVEVVATPELVVSPAVNDVNIGQNASFSVSNTNGTATYTWQTNPQNTGWINVPNNDSYSGGDTENLVISNIQLGNHHQPFRVFAVNGICSATSSESTINVLDTCITNETVLVYDTLTTYNTVNVYDTLTTYNTEEVYDTLVTYNYVDVYDTLTVYEYETVYDTLITYETVEVYDTITTYNIVEVYDTIYTTVTDTLFIDVPTGINPPNENNLLRVYPNPAHDQITIDYGDYGLLNGYSLKITNAIGQTVFITNINSQQSIIDISNWASGMYSLQVFGTSGGEVSRKTIVVAE